MHTIACASLRTVVYTKCVCACVRVRVCVFVYLAVVASPQTLPVSTNIWPLTDLARRHTETLIHTPSQTDSLTLSYKCPVTHTHTHFVTHLLSHRHTHSGYLWCCRPIHLSSWCSQLLKWLINCSAQSLDPVGRITAIITLAKYQAWPRGDWVFSSRHVNYTYASAAHGTYHTEASCWV